MKLALALVVALAACATAAAAPQPQPPPAPAAAQSPADQAVDQVQKFYAGINQVTAQFEQNVHNAQFGTDKTSKGQVWLKKPGKMYWEYLEARGSKIVPKKMFISDGTTLWDVEPDNKQVIEKNLKNDTMPVAVSFLYGKGDLKAEFNAQIDASGQYGQKGDVVLKLTPKQPSAQYRNLYLVVAPTDYHAKESIIVDSSNNVNHFHFYAPDFQTPIDDSKFVFNKASVPNYQIVDLDKQQQPAPQHP